MQIITKWKAEDGREFDDKGKCEKYEADCLEIAAIIGQLVALPGHLDSCAFANGSGYLQQDQTVFMKVRLQLLEKAKDYTDFRWIQESIDDPSVDPSWAGRIIGECGNGPINSAWYRIMNTDKQFKEWGQGYFTHNPGGREKNVCLNEA